MPSISLTLFKGERPRIANEKMPEGYADEAVSCKLSSGDLEPFRGEVPVWTCTKVGPIKEIHRWGQLANADKLVGIQSVLNTAPVQVISSKSHGLLSGATVYVDGTGLPIDGAEYAITVIDPNTFSLDGTVASGSSALGHWVYQNGVWFHWGTDVDCVRGPISGDTTERTYITGDGLPKMTYSPIAISGGGTNYPIVTYDLGVPAPDSTMTLATANETGVITGISNSNPAVVSTESQSLQNGAEVIFSGVVGMTEVNGNAYLVVNATEFSFELTDIAGANIDSSAFGVYASGGQWERTYTEVSELDKELRYYTVTYVSEIGEEGAPATPTLGITVSPGQTVDVQNIPAGPISGNYNFTKKRIYRTAASGYGADYQYVVELSLAAASFVDALSTAQLGEVLPTADYDIPPSDLHSLTVLPNGALAGASKNQVCITPINQPHAWPQLYRRPTNYPIVAMGNFGNTIVVATEADAHAGIGTDPASFTLEDLNIGQGCVSKRGLVSLGMAGVAYPSPDGLVLVGPGGVDIVTSPYMDRDNWQALNPSSIHAVLHDGKYYGFYDTGSMAGGFIFDPKSDGFGLVKLAQYPDAAYSDKNSDALYLVYGQLIRRWDYDANNLIAYTWARTYDAVKPINLSACRVLAESYNDLSLTVFADDVQVYSQPVIDGLPFRLVGDYLARRITFRLVGTDIVKNVVAATSMNEVVSL